MPQSNNQRFGLEKSQYELIQRLVFGPLLKAHAEVYVFGSRARGDHHPFSDLDVLVAESAVTPIPSGLFSKVSEDIENSSLPIKVDLVLERNLAKSYVPSVLRDRIRVG